MKWFSTRKAHSDDGEPLSFHRKNIISLLKFRTDAVYCLMTRESVFLICTDVICDALFPKQMFGMSGAWKDDGE
jgi:hypothetical protein